MSEILIFAGTTEGRRLSECLSAAGIRHTLCVATEYGELVLKEHALAKVHKGRMNREEIRAFISEGEYAAVVDATHPYAEEVTQNIKSAMKDMKLPYLRLQRETSLNAPYEGVHYFEGNADCVKALERIEGNILLTIGSKELAAYCSLEEIRDRLYVRVLPGLESLRLCMEQGISGKQILALQGPFTTEMNEAMLRQYQIKCLVTKKSGRCGGYEEKLKAAQRVGIPVYVIGCPKEDAGELFEQVCHKLELLCGKKITPKKEFEIRLAGIGMGTKGSLTKEVYQAIEEADILLGAERMLEQYQPKIEKKPFYQAEQIIPYLEKMQKTDWTEPCRRVVILFSGDSGFYSGCQKLYRALQDAIMASELEATISIMPGISSVAYLAACIGESYHDAAIGSMHGKELPNLAERIRRERKMFLLLSGLKDMHRLGEILTKECLERCTVWAGYQLSYPKQQIMELSPKECLQLKQEGLYTCCIINPFAKGKMLTHGKADAEFIRGKVPMTKEEVREVSICKLKLYDGAAVYDIGSGTGSIAVEIAGLSENIRVYAVEQREEAVSLIKANKEKFGLENIEVIAAQAPEGLHGLPVPTHAFIGGSSGRMKEILSALYQRNPRMRIVVNVISMESICEMKEVLSQYPVQNEEMVQIQVSRTRRVGAYHLMQAENPVWIYAFEFHE